MNANLLGNKGWEQCHFSPFSSRLKCLCLLQNCKPFARGLLYSVSPQHWCEGAPGWLVQTINDRHHTPVWLCTLTSFTQVRPSISANAHNFIKVKLLQDLHSHSFHPRECSGMVVGFSPHRKICGWWSCVRVSEIWHHGKHSVSSRAQGRPGTLQGRLHQLLLSQSCSQTKGALL